MEDFQEFRPKRALGTIFQIIAMVVLVLVAVWGLWLISQADFGLAFLLYLLPTVIAVMLLPLLAYRLLSLRAAHYRLARDGISLRWGLRVEDIPIDAVAWIRPASELGRPLPLPWPRWPGSVIGIRRLSGSAPIEYLAGEARPLLLIATPQTVFAISPDDPAAFLSAYHRLTEMGSLAPMPARSVYPAFLLARVWRTASARNLLLGALFLNLLLLAWVVAVAPGRSQIMLGFQRGGEAVPGVRLLLLPVLSSFFFLVDFLAGLFLYRRGIVQQVDVGMPKAPYSFLAYLLWGSAALTPLVLMVAVGFILL